MTNYGFPHLKSRNIHEITLGLANGDLSEKRIHQRLIENIHRLQIISTSKAALSRSGKLQISFLVSGKRTAATTAEFQQVPGPNGTPPAMHGRRPAIANWRKRNERRPGLTSKR
jgi:hypothetical protein